MKFMNKFNQNQNTIQLFLKNILIDLILITLILIVIILGISLFDPKILPKPVINFIINTIKSIKTIFTTL